MFRAPFSGQRLPPGSICIRTPFHCFRDRRPAVDRYCPAAAVFLFCKTVKQVPCQTKVPSRKDSGMFSKAPQILLRKSPPGPDRTPSAAAIHRHFVHWQSLSGAHWRNLALFCSMPLVRAAREEKARDGFLRRDHRCLGPRHRHRSVYPSRPGNARRNHIAPAQTGTGFTTSQCFSVAMKKK